VNAIPSSSWAPRHLDMFPLLGVKPALGDRSPPGTIAKPRPERCCSVTGCAETVRRRCERPGRKVKLDGAPFHRDRHYAERFLFSQREAQLWTPHASGLGLRKIAPTLGSRYRRLKPASPYKWRKPREPIAGQLQRGLSERTGALDHVVHLRDDGISGAGRLLLLPCSARRYVCC